MIWVWAVAGLIASIYSIGTGIAHFRQKRYVLAALGIASGIFILFIPVDGQTHAVKIDLPV